MKEVVRKNIDFKRNRGSKRSLDIGSGVLASEILRELKVKWIEEFKDSLRFLIGHKIEFNGKPEETPGWETERREIIVKDIHHTAVPEKNIIHDFHIEDIEGNRYRVSGHEPIRILD